MRTLIVLFTAVAGLVAGTASGSAASTPRCHVDDLSASFKAGSPGAGQRYATLRLTNTSDRTCHLRGYPGAQLLTSGGSKVPTDVERRDGSVKTVTLTPHERATSSWHWGAVESGDEGSPCEPLAKRIKVTPPGAYSSIEVAWTGGRVCDEGRIEVSPVRG